MTDIQEMTDRFTDFLRNYKDEHGNLTYLMKIRQLSLNEERSLSVDFKELSSYDNQFTTDATNEPSTLLEAARLAFLAILRNEDPDYVESLQKRASELLVRIINYVEQHVPLRAIRSIHIGKLIQIGGILMRASEVKPLLEVGAFQCKECKTLIVVQQEDGQYTLPNSCTNENCSYYEKQRPPVRLVPEESHFIDWQKVRIQESPEELPPGQMPRSVDVTFRGDIVDTSRPGDLVKVTGILQTTPDFSRRGAKLATFNVFIDANGVEVAEKEYEQLEITDQEKKEILELAEDPYVHERIFASIAPSIQGHELIKESIALLVFGGVGKTLPGGTRLRGRSNILIVGDPGTGKSQILKFVAQLASRGLYTSGKGTTAAGLTAAVVHDTDTGAMTLEAGALVLADQGIACIDEFDKMDPNDRTAIHEAMEQHTISIAKAGIVATLNARTSILAASNPSLGRYESSLSVQDNIKLPFTILSRFDLIWILIDTIEATRDRELAQFILGMHQHQQTPTSTKVEVIPAAFLKKYIGYANRYVIPQLTAEAAEVIENFYVDLRKTAEGGAAPIPITARQLESLVRLSEARAKMALRPKVNKEDAQASVRLMEESLRMVALDRITGKIDIDQVVSKMSAAQRSLSDKVISSMKSLEDDGISVVDEEVLIKRVTEMGVSREAAEAVIRKLVTEGILFNPQDGKVKRA